MSTVPAAPTAHLDEDADRRRRLGAGLFASVTVYAVAVMMMGLVFASTPPPRLLEGMADFQQGRVLYQWGFVGASMLAPSFVSMLLLLAASSGVPASSTRRSVATVLLGAYVAAASFAYTSQYTFFPELVDRDPEGAALWYFHDDESIPYAIDLVGYTLLGLAALLLASVLAACGRRWLAGWLAGMGALSIAAFVLYAAGAGALGGVLSLSSAALTVPIAACAIVEGRRLRVRPNQAGQPRWARSRRT
jgi:hypothetical protein